MDLLSTVIYLETIRRLGLHYVYAVDKAIRET